MKRIDAIIALGFIFMFAVLGVVYATVRTDAEECFQAPLEYGVRGLEKANGAEVQCTCSIAKPGASNIFVTRNSTKLENLLFPELPDF